MSQQPRRRRRRRRGRGGQGKKPQQQQESASQRESSQQQPKAEGGSRRRRRRGRGRSRGGGERSAAPAKSSEDIVRAPNRKRPDTLTLPPDDRRLEDIIGSLQSEMGVPQNPQEYRLTVKVVEERDGNHRTHRPSEKNGSEESNGKPKREKAPAPPRVGAGESPTTEREQAPSRKRRSRRRRRGGRNRGGGNAPKD